MEKTRYQIRIDSDIDRFCEGISGRIEMLPDIPSDKGLLILNKLLSYACDASNVMLIEYSCCLIKKLPGQWFCDNIREAVKLDNDEAWVFDLADPYVHGRLIYVLKAMGCEAYADELAADCPRTAE